MAQRTVITLTCDLPHDETGGDVEAKETLTLTLDGTARDIDACAAHAEDVRSVFGQYTEFGRPVAVASVNGRARRTPRPDSSRNHEIRAWARDRGLEVSDRGRLPASVVREYEALAS